MQPPKSPPLGIDVHLAEQANIPSVKAYPYDAIDPFTASISQRIRNNRRRNTITSVDEIGTPLPLIQEHRTRTSFRTATGSDRSISPSSAAKSSLNSKRSTPVPSRIPLATNAQEIRQTVRSSSPNRTPLPPITTPKRRNAMDTTIMAFENLSVRTSAESFAEDKGEDPMPRVPDSGRTQARAPLKLRTSRWHREPNTSRSISPTPSSVQHLRYTSYKTFSETFLPTHLVSGQVPASPNVYLGSPVLSEEIPLKTYILVFLTSILPRQIYLHCLLRLPYMYFSRVDQIFVDANMTLEEIKEMALREGVADQERGRLSQMPKTYLRLKQSWEYFIDNLLREWKTLNIISGLLLSGILTIFQVEGANADPLTRNAALCSLNCALLSLMYGCIFIIRFSGMRRVYRAAEWAIEAQHDQTAFWNVWVMLALPAIWLVWSILAYIAAIMAFMWRVRPGYQLPIDPSREDFILRVFICVVFGIGLAYAMLIINTLRRYGSNMDRAWKKRIEGFRESQEIKLPEDEPRSLDESRRSPFVDVVPPTPRAYTPVSTFTYAPERPSTTIPGIPPSFTRRVEDLESSASSVHNSESPQIHPLLFSQIHASPEPMPPLEVSDSTSGDDIVIPAESHQDIGEGRLMHRPSVEKVKNTSQISDSAREPPHILQQDHQRSSLSTVPETLEPPWNAMMRLEDKTHVRPEPQPEEIAVTALNLKPFVAGQDDQRTDHVALYNSSVEEGKALARGTSEVAEEPRLTMVNNENREEEANEIGIGERRNGNLMTLTNATASCS
ncbi:hypothetical protein AN958_11576 [Leucoagaricus sp. SymC.cos]|nr:hypothetical protein AN958_11576 [Leucoagaricus sp. SymC.cos]